MVDKEHSRRAFLQNAALSTLAVGSTTLPFTLAAELLLKGANTIRKKISSPVDRL